MDLLTRVRAEKREAAEQEHVVLDGKTLKGTQQHLAPDQRKMHHLNLYEAKTGIVLKEARVEEKAGELTHLDLFLTPVLLHARIISADALFTQHHFCQQVIAAGGDYLLVVKLNQPTLYADLSLFFQDPPADCLDWRTASTCNKGHGRLENRWLWASTELNDACGTGLVWSWASLPFTTTCGACPQVYPGDRLWDYQPHPAAS